MLLLLCVLFLFLGIVLCFNRESLLLALFSVMVRGCVLCPVLGLFLGLAIALGVVVALVRVRVLDACFVQHAFPILVVIIFSAVLRSSQYCGSVRSSCDILLDKSSRT